MAPEKPAIPRGVGGQRLSIPNQRLTVRGAIRADSLVCLCRPFRRFGLALRMVQEIRQVRVLAARILDEPNRKFECLLRAVRNPGAATLARDIKSSQS